MKKYIVIVFTGLLMSIPALAQRFWNKANMRNVKMQIDKQPYKSAYDALIKKADLYLLEPHLSVVNDKDHIPASGDIHDYMSIGRYTWPDTTKADGLPYIERDGYTNPEYYTYDREVLLKMVDRCNLSRSAHNTYSDSCKFLSSRTIHEFALRLLKHTGYHHQKNTKQA